MYLGVKLILRHMRMFMIISYTSFRTNTNCKNIRLSWLESWNVSFQTQKIRIPSLYQKLKFENRWQQVGFDVMGPKMSPFHKLLDLIQLTNFIFFLNKKWNNNISFLSFHSLCYNSLVFITQFTNVSYHITFKFQ